MNHKTRLKKYATVFWAAIIVIAISIGSFIYSLYHTSTVDLGTVTVTTSDDGTSYVNPGGVYPSGPPNFPEPTAPLPTE